MSTKYDPDFENDGCDFCEDADAAQLLGEAISENSRPSFSVASEMASRSAADNVASPADCKSTVQWIDLKQKRDKGLVILNVYDISNISAVGLLNRAGHAMGYGAYHVGVEILRREYSYGVTIKGSGLTSHRPRKNSAHRFYGSINLGKTMLENQEQLNVLKELRQCASWQGKEYHSLHHNCVHFAAALASRLGVGPVPAFLGNLADLGSSLTSFKSLWPSIRCIGECNPEKFPFEDVEILVDPYDPNAAAQEVEIDCKPCAVVAVPAVSVLPATISAI